MKLFTKSFALLAMLLCGTMAQAQTAAITVDDITLNVGEPTTVAVNFQSSELVTNPQFDINLPEGVTIVEGSEAKGTLIPNRGYSMRVAQQADGAYRFVFVSTSSKAISGTEGTLVTFDVKAEKTMTNETLTVTEASAVLDSDNDTEIAITGCTAKVTALVGMVGDATITVDPTTIEVTPGTPFSIEVKMENTAEIVSLQAELTLPEGVKLVETEDGTVRKQLAR